MFSKWRHAENISKEKENFIFSLSHTIATAYLPGGSPQPGASPCRQIFSTFSDRRFCLSPHTENTRSFSLPLRLEYYSEISRHVIFFHIENTILPRMRSISRCNASRCLRVKIICVMHYVNMFYIYGTHTHTHMVTYICGVHIYTRRARTHGCALKTYLLCVSEEFLRQIGWNTWGIHRRIIIAGNGGWWHVYLRS